MTFPSGEADQASPTLETSTTTTGMATNGPGRSMGKPESSGRRFGLRRRQRSVDDPNSRNCTRCCLARGRRHTAGRSPAIAPAHGRR